jgi:hypothetical protein
MVRTNDKRSSLFCFNKREGEKKILVIGWKLMVLEAKLKMMVSRKKRILGPIL